MSLSQFFDILLYIGPIFIFILLFSGSKKSAVVAKKSQVDKNNDLIVLLKNKDKL